MTPQQITDIRLALDMTYEQFAKAVGCSLRTVYNWERGEAKPLGVRLAALQRLKRKADKLKEQSK